jgi:hypothetical protein
MTWERAALARNRGCCRHWKQEHIGVLIEADELWWSERLRSCTPHQTLPVRVQLRAPLVVAKNDDQLYASPSTSS